MSDFGFFRAAAATPRLIPANTEYNAQQIIECMRTADKSGCGLVVFPELCVTGATCGDLFKQELLYEKSLEGLARVVSASNEVSCAIILGSYIELEAIRLNIAAFIQGGEIKGIAPKMFVHGAESRWFAPGNSIAGNVTSLNLMGDDIPFGALLFKDPRSCIIIGIEISSDADRMVSPGTLLSLNGANIIVNPSASSDAAGGAARRRNMISGVSGRNKCCYVLSSAGVHESTADMVFSGHSLIAENGRILSESERFNRDSSVLLADIDFEMIRRERMNAESFYEAAGCYADPVACAPVYINPLKLFDEHSQALARHYSKTPFIPDSPLSAAERCSEVFQLQCAGLARRLEHAKPAKTILGVSGGLDSTLALLVCAETHRMIGKSVGDITALTMPGFGTTDKTRENACSIASAIGADFREISIKTSVAQHFIDIGHDIINHDVTYENAQARERTQILMDLANQEHGMVIGTGDLSEAALGWCTYNGDHMSMYNVNAGVPKTLLRHIIQWFIDYKLNGPAADRDFCPDNVSLSYALEDVLKTPISPELLPPDAHGNIVQETESSVGPYMLNDFFIYHTIRYGLPPEKLFYIAKLAFADDYPNDTLKKWLTSFYERFFSQQYKRNCSPDGPQTGSVCLSPRGSLLMPSDADYKLWVDETAALANDSL